MRLLTLLLLLGLAACSSAPKAPANNPLPAEPPSVDASVINIPVTLDLEQLRGEVMRQLPSPISSGSETQVLRLQMGKPANGGLEPGTCSITELNCLQKKVTQAIAVDYTAPVETVITHQAYVRDLAMSMTGNFFSLTAQVEFSVSARVKSRLSQFGVASCGINEPMPRLEFTLSGSVNWGAMGDLVITPRPYGLKWLRPCTITTFKLDVETLLNLPGLREELQSVMHDAVFSSLRQASLRTQLAKAWPELNAPRELQQNLWLVPYPQKVAFIEPAGNGRFVTTGVLVRAYPEIVSGPKPQIVLLPVPTPERGISGEGVHLAVRGDIALADAEQLLARQLAGKPMVVSGRTVQIDSIRLYGHLDQAVIGLTLSQPVKAEIFVLGQPVFDVEKNEVRFEKLHYSLGTKDFLVKAANWLLGDSFRETLQKQARFRFDDDLADTLKEFRDFRQDIGNGMVLKGGVSRVRPQGLYFTQDRLIAHVQVDGKLALEMKGK